MGLNHVVVQGRLTKDVELRYTNSEKAVASFTVAVDSTGDKADFLPVVAWTETATFIDKYFGKGDMILIEGRLSSRSYEDKNGNKRTAYEVVANRVYFCGSKKEDKPKGATFSPPADVDDGELPF